MTPATTKPDDVPPVSLLTGDRLCTACGYNLINQQVSREPHYGLLVVRCPECGDVAAVQEYPALGRWAPRLAALAAAFWLVGLLGAWAASAGVMTGLSLSAGEWCASTYAGRIRAMHQADLAAAAASAPASPGPGGGAGDATGAAAVAPAPQAVTVVAGRGVQVIGAGADDFSVWWPQQDPAAILASAGGWWGAIDWHGLRPLIPGGLGTFVIGCFWSVALLFVRRRYAVLWALAIALLASTFATIGVIGWERAVFYAPWQVARWQISAPIVAMSLAFFTLTVAAGILAGRTIARGVVRALLPPRMRSSLSVLWTAQGLSPPVTSRNA